MNKNRDVKLTILINGQEIKNTLQDIGKEISKLNKELRNMSKDDPNFSNKVAELQKAKKAYADLKKEINGVPGMFDKMAQSVAGFLSVIGIGLGIQTFITALYNVYTVIKNFDSAQSELAAILGKSKSEIIGLTALTLKLGITTAFTATQATQAATELAKLGFSEKDIKASLEGIIKGSLALGSEIPETAELVASTLKAFNLEAKDTNRVVSTLAAGANATSLGFESLKVALGNVAPAAAAANYTVEQTVALLGLITDTGVDASTAGTSLRNIFIQLSAKGITLDDALGQIANSQNKLTKATELFDVRSAVSALALANQKDKVNSLTQALTGQENVLNEMADTRMDNLEGSVTLFKSAWDGLMLSIEKGDGLFAQGIRNVVDLGTSILRLITPTQQYSDELLKQQVSMNLLAVEYLRLDEHDEKRGQMLDKLKANYPELLGYISGEVVTNKNLAEALQAVNSQYARKIATAKTQEKLSKAIDDEAKSTQELNKVQQKLLQTLIEISNSTPEIKVNLQADDLVKEANKVSEQMDKLHQGYSKNAIKLKSLSDGYVVAGYALKGYSAETEKARKESDQMMDMNTRSEKQFLSNIITYQRASEVISRYKNGLITQSEAYTELTKNSTASREEFILFENVIDNFSKETLNSLISQLARNNLSMDNNRETIQNSNLKYADAIKVHKEYANLFPEAIRKTDEFKKSTEGLTLSQIQEKTELIGRIHAMNQNINLNDLMVSSLDALRGRYDDLAKSVPDTSSIKGVRDIKSSLEEKHDAAKSNMERSKLKKEIDEYQKLEDEMTGKADEERRRKAEEAAKKAAQQRKQLAEKARQERKKLQDESIKAEEQFRKTFQDSERKSQDEILDLMDDGYAKEKAKLDMQYIRKREDLLQEIEALDKLSKEYTQKSIQAGKLGDDKTASKFKLYADKQKDIIREKNSTIQALEIAHNNKVQKLNYDFKQKELERQKATYAQELQDLDIKHNEELASITSLASAKSVLQNYIGKEELDKIRTIEEAKKALTLAQEKETYEAQLKQMIELRTKLNDELQKNADDEANGLEGIFTKEQVEEKKKQLDELILKSTELQKILSGQELEKKTEASDKKKTERSQLLSEIDLLGFSADEWEKAFTYLDTWTEKIKATSMVVQALQNAWSMMYEAQSAASQRAIQQYEAETNKKKEALQSQLDQGYINQAQYDAKVKKLEADMEIRRTDMEYKTAMQKYHMDIANAVSNTALGVTRALASTAPPYSFILAGLVSAMGALQLGIITKNRPQKASYAEGGVTRGLGFRDESGEEVAGVAHADEYYIPRWLRKDPEVAHMERYIEYKRKGGKKSFAEGGATTSTISVPVAQPAQENTSSDAMLLYFLKENIAILNDLKNKGVVAWISPDVKNMQKYKEAMKRSDEIINNGKIMK